MDQYSLRLLQVCESVVGTWLERCFDGVVARQNRAAAVDFDRRAAAIEGATTRSLADLQSLLEVDPTEQKTNPLALLREATMPVTDELRRIGATPIERDEFHQRSFPSDVFGLCPATWADIHESLVEPGLEWGAFKAASVISRRRSERSEG
jgi:hypothetical protein